MEEDSASSHWVERLRNDDESVLTEILRELGPSIVSRLRREYGHGTSASGLEDAISEGLFRLWNDRYRFDESRASLKHFFYVLTRNALIDIYRKNRLESVSLENRCAADRDAESECAESSNQEHLISGLSELIAELPPQDRAIIEARCAYGGDGEPWTAAVVDELSMTPKAVRVRWIRLRKRLISEIHERGFQIPK